MAVDANAVASSIENMSEEEKERLLSDPLLRNLQFQLSQGVEKIDIETNEVPPCPALL